MGPYNSPVKDQQDVPKHMTDSTMKSTIEWNRDHIDRLWKDIKMSSVKMMVMNRLKDLEETLEVAEKVIAKYRSSPFKKKAVNKGTIHCNMHKYGIHTHDSGHTRGCKHGGELGNYGQNKHRCGHFNGHDSVYKFRHHHERCSQGIAFHRQF